MVNLQHSYLSISPYLRYVATLPGKISILENCRQSEICIAINDEWQGTIAKALTCDGLLALYHSILTANEMTYIVSSVVPSVL